MKIVGVTESGHFRLSTICSSICAGWFHSHVLMVLSICDYSNEGHKLVCNIAFEIANNARAQVRRQGVLTLMVATLEVGISACAVDNVIMIQVVSGKTEHPQPIISASSRQSAPRSEVGCLGTIPLYIGTTALGKVPLTSLSNTCFVRTFRVARRPDPRCPDRRPAAWIENTKTAD